MLCVEYEAGKFIYYNSSNLSRFTVEDVLNGKIVIPPFEVNTEQLFKEEVDAFLKEALEDRSFDEEDVEPKGGRAALYCYYSIDELPPAPISLAKSLETNEPTPLFEDATELKGWDFSIVKDEYGYLFIKQHVDDLLIAYGVLIAAWDEDKVFFYTGKLIFDSEAERVFIYDEVANYVSPIYDDDLYFARAADSFEDAIQIVLDEFEPNLYFNRRQKTDLLTQIIEDLERHNKTELLEDVLAAFGRDE